MVTPISELMANNTFRKILIIKPGAIGDLLQMTPVIRALARRYPGAHITVLVGTTATADLFSHNPHVGATLVFDRRGAHRSCSSRHALWQQLRRERFDLVVNFQRSNIRTWLLATAALPCRVLVYHKDPSRHVVDNYLQTLSPLGIAGQDRTLELFPGIEDEQYADQLFTKNGWGGKTVIALNPGASHAVNRWGASRFASLADLLQDRFAGQILIIGGPEDGGLAEEILSLTRSKPIVLTGRATLLQLGAILRKCTVLVSGDTGPLHLATAVGTRVVALFGAADPARTGPVGNGHRIVQAGMIPCVPCRSRTCKRTPTDACMEAIAARDVADAVSEMIKSSQQGPQKV